LCYKWLHKFYEEIFFYFFLRERKHYLTYMYLSRIFNLCHHLFQFSSVILYIGNTLITEYFIKHFNHSLYQTWHLHFAYNHTILSAHYLLYFAKLMNRSIVSCDFNTNVIYFVIVNISLISLSTNFNYQRKSCRSATYFITKS